MVVPLSGESEHWRIVLVVVERDGSLVLVAEPTRQAVPCPKCGELSRRQHSSYERRPLDLVLDRIACSALASKAELLGS